MVKKLNKDDLQNVAHGAGFMGSGGGGPLTAGLALVDNMPSDAVVKLVSVEEMQPGLLAGVVADMGAPAKMLDVKDPASMVAAFDKFGEFLKVRELTLGYTLPAEVGGENTIVPLAVSQARRVPCVDADGAGRAVPSLTQTTMYQRGVNPDPAYLANDVGEAVAIRVDQTRPRYDPTKPPYDPTKRVEEMARPILADGFDEQAGLAMWAMDSTELKQAAPIRGNIEVARQLGELLGDGKKPGDPIEAVRHFFEERHRGGYLLFRGRLESYTVQTSGGFDLGIATLRNDAEATLRTYSQNENLIAWCSESSSPLAMAPDSICYLTADGRPFSNADIANWHLEGAEVAVIGLKADPALRAADKVMASFASALEALGYAGPYTPIEEITQVCA